MMSIQKRRIVVCVDGTWYGADGPDGNSQGNNSNVFRIFTSIKGGKFESEGEIIEQVAKYFHGIGVRKKPLDKFNDGISGEGCKELIKEVYQHICTQVKSSRDEVWLYGFSRGAYVVRAVAGLLHHTSVLSETPESDFNSGFQLALKFMTEKHRKEIQAGGELYHFLSTKTRESPIIQFLGAFDTVIKTTDPAKHDLSFTDSIKHVRHAVALNENRPCFSPEFLTTDQTTAPSGRSLIQAWFIGAHADIGGGARHDGLALYPLQWVLLESRKHGLVLEHNPERKELKNLIENPLELTMLSHLVSTNQGNSSDDPVWNFKYQNGVEVDMYDLRKPHNHGNLQKWPRNRLEKRSPKPRESTHKIMINTGFKIVLSGNRHPFQEGELRGYCQHANGDIIHPSVYFIMDTYPLLGIKEKLKGQETDLQRFRNAHLYSSGSDPWVRTREFDTVKMGICRILICGNTGVGKSTLLNRIFGIPVAEECGDRRVTHDINEAFEFDHNPGIIIHDSEGFQSGNKKEVDKFEAFIKEKSPFTSPHEKLHAIWVCIETDNSRPVQTAIEEVIRLVSKHAPSLPVFIVGTKKDSFLITEGKMNWNDVEALESSDEVDADVKAAAVRLLEDRQRVFESRYEEECAGFNGETMQFAFVSRGDKSSIRALMHKTMEAISDDSAYMRFIAAQVCDVEPKIGMAINHTVDMLRYTINSVAASSILPYASGVIAPTISRVLCNKIVRCFGFPKITGDHVDDIMNKVVWANLAKFMVQTIIPHTAVLGGITALSLATGFGALCLVEMVPLLEMPPAARMIVKCACDLIIILERAFATAGKFVTKDQIHQATIEYKTERPSEARPNGESIRSNVHREVENMIPWFSTKSITMSSQRNLARIRTDMKEVIEKHRFGKLGDLGRLSRENSSSNSHTPTSAKSSLEPEAEPAEIQALFSS